MSEKTEAPSDKKLRQAREDGNFAKSKTLAAALGSAVAMGTLLSTLPAMSHDLLAYTRHALLDAAANQISPSAALLQAALVMAMASAPVLLAAMAGSLVGAAMQVGVNFSTKTLAFKLENLSPAKGAKKLFSKKNLVEVLRSSLSIGVVLWLTWSLARESTRLCATLPSLDAFHALTAGLALVKGLVVKCLLTVLALGAFDLLYEKHAHFKNLMMSKEDLKKEHKESEGDPHQKAKRKALAKSLQNGTAKREVRQATVVVVNPTHVAVALRYDPKESAAPTIVAKGTEEIAATIRAEARLHKVPIIKDISLAWTLVRYDVGDDVPEELYQAVAVVLQKVHELGALPAQEVRNPNRSAS